MTTMNITVVGVEVPRLQLTTTLYSLRKHHACEGRYAHLIGKLSTDYGDKEPINILTILDHNGVADALWALCAVDQNCEQIARLMAADFAEEALAIFEQQHPDDKRPHKAIEVSRRFAVGQATDAAWAAARAAARDAARDAAGDAARAAAGGAAGAAARDAARGAAWAAAWNAARGAARGAAWDAARGAAWKKQSEIIRRYLLTDEEAA
jgi:hypothetical protein